MISGSAGRAEGVAGGSMNEFVTEAVKLLTDFASGSGNAFSLSSSKLIGSELVPAACSAI
jgi:hypothetical protein